MEGRLAILVGGVRRFFLFIAGLAAVTTLGSLGLAALAGWRADRAVAVGFDLVGVFLLVAGFFVGNRGPTRLKGQESAPFYGPRRMRWATIAEREEALSDSAVFVAVGLAMILIGIVVDSRYSFY